jgi:peptide/nickel transport system permease protein
MRRFAVQRLLGTVPVLLGVVTLVFLVMHVLPGEPVAVLAAQGGGSAEDIARLRQEYGLDSPVWLQFLRFLLSLAKGDLGRSLLTRQSVSQTIVQQAPSTVVLACSALVVGLGVGMPLGIVAAMRPRTWMERLCMGISVIGVSIPIPLSGLAMILVFSLALQWLPASGRGTISHLMMPSAVMGLVSAGSIARLVRVQLAEVLREEYITVARAKGLAESTLLIRHALRRALVPVITVVGLQFGFMLGGAVATETVFGRPGLGRTLAEAIVYKDYPLVQGMVIVSAALYTIVNLAVELAYGYLHPRIHYE